MLVFFILKVSYSLENELLVSFALIASVNFCHPRCWIKLCINFQKNILWLTLDRCMNYLAIPLFRFDTHCCKFCMRNSYWLSNMEHLVLLNMNMYTHIANCYLLKQTGFHVLLQTNVPIDCLILNKWLSMPY